MSPKDDERVELRVSSDDLKRWRVTAGAEGLQLSEWIRRRCNEVAVDQELIDVVDRKLAEREQARRQEMDRRVASQAGMPEVPNPALAARSEERRREASKKRLAADIASKKGTRR